MSGTLEEEGRGAARVVGGRGDASRRAACVKAFVGCNDGERRGGAAGNGIRCSSEQRTLGADDFALRLLQTLLVRAVQPVIEMLQRMPLSLELHAEHEQRDDENEKDGAKSALHGS